MARDAALDLAAAIPAEPTRAAVSSGRAAASGTYMPQLDGLRVFAVLGVLVAHDWGAAQTRLPWLFGQLEWGHLGVQLFFVLSGFLITGILLRCRSGVEAQTERGGFYLRQFYARRFLRIFPIYYLILFTAMLIHFHPVPELWPWLFTYTTNIYTASQVHWIGRVGHFWTLAIEEQFYLVWPWLVIFARRRILFTSVLLMIALAPLYRLYAVIHNPADFLSGDRISATFTLACLDSLGSGALLAMVAHARSREVVHRYLRTRVLPVAAGGYLLLHVLYYYHVSYVLFFMLGDLFLALIFCWLVVSAAQGFGGRAGRALGSKPMTYTGKITYGMYVYHNFVPLVFLHAFTFLGLSYELQGPLNFVLSSIATFVVAALSWQLFEQPINNLKHRLTYNPRVAVTRSSQG